MPIHLDDKAVKSGPAQKRGIETGKHSLSLAECKSSKKSDVVHSLSLFWVVIIGYIFLHGHTSAHALPKVMVLRLLSLLCVYSELSLRPLHWPVAEAGSTGDNMARPSLLNGIIFNPDVSKLSREEPRHCD